MIHEASWFHWITNRALRRLVAEGVVVPDARSLNSGSVVVLLWHRRNRYYLRQSSRIVSLVEEYSEPSFSHAVGERAELLVLDGFSRHKFVQEDRNTRSFGGRVWTYTNHDVDFIFSRDGIAYGVEIKNTLGYMPHDELEVKIALCQEIGVRPVFVARMLPKPWIKEIADAGGILPNPEVSLVPPHSYAPRPEDEERA